MRETYRILDANLNRAREALRVAEEYGRFVLDDAGLASLAKQIRSELQGVVEALPRDALLAARDTDADVGTTLTSDTEGRRGSPADVATAACKRLTEAMRAIEEYGKLLDPKSAAAVEKLRYRAYAFEQRLLGRAGVRQRLRSVRLYLLLSSDLCKTDPVLTAHAAIAGGVDCIQLREKTLPDRQLLELARRLRALTTQHERLFIVNDRPDIAALVGADGVHVGQDDLPVDEARRVVGGDRLVGLSTHSLAQGRTAVESGADYIGVGPMFATPTKASTPVAGPGLLKEALAELDVPTVAIGGISADNVGQLAELGARAVAVSRAILAAADPAAEARAIKERLLKIGT